MKAAATKFWPQALLGSIALVIVGLLLLGPGGRDDVYKTLWPAETLAQSGKILNYNGDSIEQSSSLLEVLLLGATRLLVSGALANWAVALSLICGVAGIFLLSKLAKSLELQNNWALPLALALQGAWAYWSMAGLDATLAGLCWLLFLGGLLHLHRQGEMGYLPLSILPMLLVRPENGLIALGTIALVVLHQTLSAPKSVTSPAHRNFRLAFGMTAIAFLGLLAWRFWHGGHWLPQTALAKSDGLSWWRLRAGAKYLFLETWRHPELLPLWIGLITLGIGQAQRHKSNFNARLLLVFLGVALSFVLLSGGDWMENGRFLVPFIPVLVLVFFSQIDRLTQPLKSILSWGYVAANGLGLIWIALHFNLGYPLNTEFKIPKMSTASEFGYVETHNKTHLRDIYPLEILRSETERIYQLKKGKVEILSQQAGFLMYHLSMSHAGKFQFTDLVGLSTDDFTQCAVTRDRGRFPGGLNMDLDFLMKALPDLAQQCGLTKPDLIFGLDDEQGSLSKILLQHDYVLVARQQGKMPDASSWLPGMELDAIEFICVEKKWANGHAPIIQDFSGRN